ncbi:MAG: acyl-CoA reductase [Sphingomonadales bacterium]|nr:acyl-CoA reductase [Sphingomonadales bacterium]
MPSDPSVSNLSKVLHQWGLWMKSAILRSDWHEWSASVAAKNPWFEPIMLEHALNAWADALQPANLEHWLCKYLKEKSKTINSTRVGLILPGNIPLAGLHDVICTLIAGHKAQVKASSEDACLISWAIQGLLALQPEWKSRFELVQKVNNVDALIATGSSTTLPYFEQYFGHIPHIFRSHRNSIAILDGKESTEDWAGLGQDIFLYYGKGCRNVSKLLIPKGMNPEHILDGLVHYPWEGQHYRYRNNLDYQLALHMLDRTPFYHNGSVILRQNQSASSPLAVLHFDYYQSGEDLANKILHDLPAIQCCSGHQLIQRWGQDSTFRMCFDLDQWNSWCNHTVEFGQCQFPEIERYADGIDTMTFLMGLSRDLEYL